MIARVGQAALALTSWLDLAIVLKATIVLAFGLAALPLARRARAAVRHLLMAATFGTVLVLPLVMSTAPMITIHVPLAVADHVTSLVSNEMQEALVPPPNSMVLRGDTNAHRSLPSFGTLVRSIWAVGAMLLLALLAIDLRRLRVLRRGGLPWLAYKELMRSLAATSGVHRSIDVLLHEGVSAPLTCGFWRPTILLPIDASEWQEVDLRRALVHELEHVRRGDWATQLVARVACACYWFHPLVWMAWGRLRLEAERACDDAVVQCAECTEYAEQLVSLARRMSTAHTLPSLAMANRTDLSARVVALLDGTQSRGRVGYAATASVVSMACLVGVLVTSVRAIAAPSAHSVAARAAQPARESVVAPRLLPELGVPPRQGVGHPVLRGNPKRSTKQRPRRPIGERMAESPDSVWKGDSPDSTAKVQSTLTVIDRPIMGSASAVGRVSHSSTGSGTATRSVSASSSSN